MRHFFGDDEGELHESAHDAVLAPGSLEDEFFQSFLGDGVAVGFVVVQHVANDSLRARAVTRHHTLAHHRLALTVEGLARTLVHIEDCSLRVAHRHCAFNVFCPIKFFHDSSSFVFTGGKGTSIFSSCQ